MLIPTNLSYFDEGGELWPLRQAMAASLLMYHFDVASAYGPTNAIVARVLEIAQLINVQCSGVYDPVEVIKIWSKQISDDYKAMNRDDVSVTVKETIAKQSKQINALTNQLSDAVTQLNQLNTSMIHLQKMMASLVGTQAGPKALSQASRQFISQQTDAATQSMDYESDYPESNQMIDLVSPPKPRNLNPNLIPPSNTKKAPPTQPVNSAQIKVNESAASISISSILIRLSKRHFERYKKFTRVNFKQLSSVVCREFPGLRSSQMDVNRVLACVDSVMTTHILSDYLTADEVDAVAEVIQSRVVSWVVKLETMLKLRKPSSKKSTRVTGYVIGIAKRLMKLQKQYQKQTSSTVLPNPGEDWEPMSQEDDS